MLSTAALLTNVIEPLLMASMRVLAALVVAPLFPAAIFPMLVRNTVVLALSLAVYPQVAAQMPALSLAAPAWLLLIGKEFLVGALIGVSVGVLIHAFGSVGAMIDVQTGMSNAVLYDPFGGHSEGPMSSFMVRLAVTLFVAGGGLYVLVTLLFESFRLWPVASFYPAIDIRLADFAGGQFGSIAQLIVRVAAPVVLVLALVDLGFGLINRVVPQLNVFFFTMPIKGVLSVFMIALLLPYVVDVVHQQIDVLRSVLERLAAALSAHR